MGIMPNHSRAVMIVLLFIMPNQWLGVMCMMPSIIKFSTVDKRCRPHFYSKIGSPML